MGIITNLKENKTLFIPCDCRSEVLMIEYDHSIHMADLAIYQSDASYRAKVSLWQRLRYCWEILCHKKPYTDAIILNHKQLKELKIFLSGLDL